MNVTVHIERRTSEPARPEWICPSCSQGARHSEVRENLMVCPHCGHHLRIGARERIRQLTDEGTFRELWTMVTTLDPLGFTDLEEYPERVREPTVWEPLLPWSRRTPPRGGSCSARLSAGSPPPSSRPWPECRG